MNTPPLKRSSGLPVPAFGKDQCKVLGCLGRGIVLHPPPGPPIGHSSLSVWLLVARATCYPLSDTDQTQNLKSICREADLATQNL